MRIIEDYAWPGNVRELQNVIQFAVLKASGPIIGAQQLPPNLAASVATPHVDRRRPQLSRAAVEQALRETRGNRVKAARLLGVSRATLYRFFSAAGQ
jgi:transcriptional regulator of acetoin/glycerol metabolism